MEFTAEQRRQKQQDVGQAISKLQEMLQWLQGYDQLAYNDWKYKDFLQKTIDVSDADKKTFTDRWETMLAELKVRVDAL